MIKNIYKLLKFCGKENRKKYMLAIGFCFLGAIANGFSVLALWITCEAIVERKASFADIFGALLCMALAITGKIIAERYLNVCQAEAAYGMCCGARDKIAKHLRRMPIANYNPANLKVFAKLQDETGKIKNLTKEAVAEMAEMSSVALVGALSDTICTVIMIIITMVLNLSAGLIMLGGFVLYLAVNVIEEKVAQKRLKNRRIDNKKFEECASEFVDKIFDGSSYKSINRKGASLYEDIDAKKNSDCGGRISDMPLDGLGDLLLQIAVVCVLGCVISMYLNTTITPVTAIVLIATSLSTSLGISATNKYAPLLENISADIDRVNEVVDGEEMNPDGDDLVAESGNISVRNVSYQYEDMVYLGGAMMEIESGSRAVPVGNSAEARVILAYLISGFMDDYEGEILLDGKNIRDYSLSALLRNFEFIYPGTYLFKDTIANNIRFANATASEEDVVNAAKAANCHEFIMGLEKGYETVVGIDIELTAKEILQIALARATFRNAPILVVDGGLVEAIKDEGDLIDALKSLISKKTLILTEKTEII